MQSARSPFKTRIVLGEIQPRQAAEYSGPDLPSAGVPVLELATNRTNYQLPYPLKAPVALGDKGRDFIIGLFARKSSTHLLRVVATLSNGRAVTSRPVSVTYARPRPPSDLRELKPQNTLNAPPQPPTPDQSPTADTCESLWNRRNAIWHRYAYCFTTTKAQQVFGNAGCFRDLNAARAAMSPADIAEVDALVARERQMGCR